MPDAVPQPEQPHRFEFELDRAIRDQVVATLEASPLVPLAHNCGPNESGIYALYYQGRLVYIGKASQGTTKSRRTLRSRLNEHVGKLGNRENLSMTELSCRFLTIESDWFVWAAEFALINHFQPEWNNSGLGSKTPGVGRPGTHRVSRFDQMFPRRPGAPPVADDDEDDEDDPPPDPAAAPHAAGS